MTLAETLLPKLADWQPAGEGRPAPEAFPLPEHGWTVRLSADRADSVGCMLTEVRADRSAPVSEDAVALETHARKVAGRVTGLLEPLRLIEVDRPKQVAVLRSESPPTKGDTVHFYEVRFQGQNAVTVERFQAAKGSPARKKQVPFALTHEVIAKLVDDLVRD